MCSTTYKSHVYNEMAQAVYQCNPDSGPLSGNAICSDPRLIDFQNNYYDATNRPYDSGQALKSLMSHAPPCCEENSFNLAHRF
jgi:hypothetical protein